MPAVIEIKLDSPPPRGGGGGGGGRGGRRGGGGGSPTDPDDDLPLGDDYDEEEEELKRIRKELARESLIRRARKAGKLPTPDEELPVGKEVDEQAEFDRDLRKRLGRESLYRRAGLIPDPRAEERERREQEREVAKEDFKKRERVQFYGALASQTVGAAGAAGTGAARNNVDAMGAINAAAMGLSRLGPVGLAAGAALKVVGEAATAVQRTIDAFVQRGRELAGVNGNIAGAAARADAQRYMADIREAEQLGPQFAKIIENQNKAELATRELLLPIKEFLLERLNAGIENGLQTLLLVLEGVNRLPGIGGRLTDIVTRIKAILEGNGGGDPITSWLNALTDFSAAPIPAPMAGVGRMVPVPRPGPLGVP